MSSAPTTPDTIVLIHGFWVTPRSWEHWKTHYESKGYTVLAPAYPGFEVEVEALNADPTPIEEVTVPQIVGHLEEIVGGLDKPPILIGHSAGGVFTQVLLDHGFGAGRDQFGTDRGRPGDSVVPAPLNLPGAEEPREPAPGRRIHPRTMDLRVHQYLHR